MHFEARPGALPRDRRSRSFSLISPQGALFEGVNLSGFIRDHAHLFKSTDISYPICHCNVYRGLIMVIQQRTRTYKSSVTGEVSQCHCLQWKGWTRSDTDRSQLRRMSPESRKGTSAPRLSVDSVRLAFHTVKYARVSEGMKRMWADPLLRAKRLQALRQTLQSPAYREKMAIITQRRMKAGWRPGFLTSEAKAKSKESRQDPTIKERNRQALVQAWSDPVRRARRVEAMRKGKVWKHKH